MWFILIYHSWHWVALPASLSTCGSSQCLFPCPLSKPLPFLQFLILYKLSHFGHTVSCPLGHLVPCSSPEFSSSPLTAEFSLNSSRRLGLCFLSHLQQKPPHPIPRIIISFFSFVQFVCLFSKDKKKYMELRGREGDNYVSGTRGGKFNQNILHEKYILIDYLKALDKTRKKTLIYVYIITYIICI